MIYSYVGRNIDFTIVCKHNFFFYVFYNTMKNRNTEVKLVEIRLFNWYTSNMCIYW